MRAPSWRNEVTLRTVEYGFGYEPGAYVGQISPTPLLLIVAVKDHLTVSNLGSRRTNERSSRSGLCCYQADTSTPMSRCSNSRPAQPASGSALTSANLPGARPIDPAQSGLPIHRI